MKRSVQMHNLNPAIRAVDAEAVRAIFWSRASISARIVAVMAAGFPMERANSSLMSFDTSERDIVWSALQNLLCELTAIQKCMCGGHASNVASKVH
ncbi:hypothetical protein [Janthinobacterium sp. GW458P]|uniref:hypothetical protein n=1 Tax=Janthinobacterium sp. GW458P TaxID=1981504 RepID=UPI00111D8861|nr:hypothetical protein [Janthinobacterium sp. GW458P]MBE3027381.1 hypothetical protein [Janthinobacterium sp. GW458P]